MAVARLPRWSRVIVKLRQVTARLPSSLRSLAQRAWVGAQRPLTRVAAAILSPCNKATALRWLDLAALGLLACGLCFLLLPALDKVTAGTLWLLDYLAHRIQRTAPWTWAPLGVPVSTLIVANTVTLVVTAAILLLLRLDRLRMGRLRHFHVCPPTWAAAVAPTLLMACLLGQGQGADLTFEGILRHSLLTMSALVLLLALLIRGAREWRPRRVSDDAAAPTAEATLKAFAEDPTQTLIPWLLADAPVTKPSQDLFEAVRYAQRIAERITDQHLGRIGLIGPWGAGKTSVLKLVEHLLHQSTPFRGEYHERWRRSSRRLPWVRRLAPPRILTCWVRAWGFASESAAVVVLREAVAELQKHVDCLRVQGLPEKYLAAIKGVAPSWLHGPLAIACSDSPSAQLGRLDALLEAINARLVIFIEDLDRNFEAPDVAFFQSISNKGSSIESSVTNDVAARPNGRILLEVESLLDRMSRAKRISFVLAISRNSA